ncbi:hypothetical protein HPC37_02975 [Pasteurellaceae bacterium 20609_3]|uniref:hypothetical protein n=1 Tax=Spirabiliibacterium mucosae TaxID=28156 RepID=UPI001AAC7CE9|nr:hypothetical protein [Spirabiliibacterium mucosae]MBE2897817.1 hypothetical protein [Spirabiliibacterium mucosae]
MYSALKQSVLDSMEKDGYEPIIIESKHVVGEDIEFSVFRAVCNALNHDDFSSVLDTEKLSASPNQGPQWFRELRWNVDKVERNTIYVTVSSVALHIKSTKIGRAIRKVFPGLTDEQVKRATNELTARLAAKYWVCTTDRFIELHYQALKRTQKFTSCMAYNNGRYGRRREPSHQADYVDEYKNAGVLDLGDSYYAHPCEAYNHTEFRLALITSLDPKSKAFKEAEYPFIARAIVHRDTEHGDVVFAYNRAYGNEQAVRAMSCSRAFKGDMPDTVELRQVRDEDGRLVLPYVDCDNRIHICDEDNSTYDDAVPYAVFGYTLYDTHEVEHSSGRLNCDREPVAYCEGSGEPIYDEYDIIWDVHGDPYADWNHDDYLRWVESRDEYYPLDETVWDDLNDANIAEDDAVEYIGTDGYTYYTHQDEIGDWILELAGGRGYDAEYAHRDCNLAEISGELYLIDKDDDVVYSDIEDQYVLKSDSVEVLTSLDGDTDWADADNDDVKQLAIAALDCEYALVDLVEEHDGLYYLTTEEAA